MRWLAVFLVVALAGCQASGGGPSGPRLKCNTYVDFNGDARSSCY